jgi:hypothetical protein
VADSRMRSSLTEKGEQGVRVGGFAEMDGECSNSSLPNPGSHEILEPYSTGLPDMKERGLYDRAPGGSVFDERSSTI